MTVDMLMGWLATIGDFPVLAFILAVVISGIPLFLVMALNAMVAVYVERKVSAFMMDRIGPMGQGPGLHAGKWGLLQTAADAIKLLVKEDTVPESSDKFYLKWHLSLFLLVPSWDWPPFLLAKRSKLWILMWVFFIL